MDRNRFLTDKPRSVVQAEKTAERKKAAEAKKAREMAELSSAEAKKAAIKKEIVRRAKSSPASERITLRSSDVPRGYSYGGCGASRGGC